MKNALILHGTQGNSKENWFPWLKKELEKKGFQVWLPDLPGSDVPDLNVYNKFLLGNRSWKYDSNSFLIGHSSGAVAILNLLDKLPEGVIVDTCILVAPFEKESTGGRWEANRKLFKYVPDIKKIASRSKKFVLFISDNDPYCTVDYVERLGKDLNARVVVTRGDGHFSVSSGGNKYKKLPVILEYL